MHRRDEPNHGAQKSARLRAYDRRHLEKAQPRTRVNFPDTAPLLLGVGEILRGFRNQV